MYDDDPFNNKPPGNIAFRVGLIAGVVMIVVHLVFLLITQETGSADFISWIIELFVMLMAARTAAQQQYKAQIESLDPLKGVMGAGVGAALSTAFIVWVFIIVRDMWISADAFAAMFGIIRVPIDIFLALGLGGWGGYSTIRRHEDLQNRFYDNQF